MIFDFPILIFGTSLIQALIVIEERLLVFRFGTRLLLSIYGASLPILLFFVLSFEVFFSVNFPLIFSCPADYGSDALDSDCSSSVDGREHKCYARHVLE